MTQIHHHHDFPVGLRRQVYGGFTAAGLRWVYDGGFTVGLRRRICSWISNRVSGGFTAAREVVVGIGVVGFMVSVGLSHELEELGDLVGLRSRVSRVNDLVMVEVEAKWVRGRIRWWWR